MKDLKRIFRYLKPYGREFCLASLFVVVESSFELIIPMIMASLLDKGVAEHDIGYILSRGGLMVFCAVISLCTGLLYARFSAKAAAGFGASLREAEYKKIQEYSFSNLDHFETSSLITRLTTDITVMQNALVSGTRPLIRGPVMLVMGLIFACFLNAKLALVFAVCMPVLAVILIAIVSRVAPMYGKLQKAVDRVNSVVQENLTAIRAVKAFVRGTYEEEKFEEVNVNLQKTSERTFHFAVLNLPSFQLTMYAAILMILWFGGRMIQIGGMQVGELTGFLSYVIQIMNSLMMISNIFLLMTRSMASAKRINQVFDEPLDLVDGGQAVQSGLTDSERALPVGEDGQSDQGGLMIKDGGIEFDHVSFKYKPEAEENVLTDIQLSIEAGQTVGIIGGTGSAKSTLVQLIPRLYDVTEGTVRIDARDVREYPLRMLRDAVGIVLQKNILFSGTIRDNLKWGDPKASEEELKEVCRIACVDEFLERLPEGLDTDLGQGGVNVSGGQKQRLCIARTLLKKPKILIFDDSTSAVDTATDARIRKELAALTGVTKLIIAQRIASVMDADQIVILDDGRIHAVGTHGELLRSDTIYQELYESQQKGGQSHGETL